MTYPHSTPPVKRKRAAAKATKSAEDIAILGNSADMAALNALRVLVDKHVADYSTHPYSEAMQIAMVNAKAFVIGAIMREQEIITAKTRYLEAVKRAH